MNIEFSIWLASKTRWVHLIKSITFPSVPRLGEYVKFNSSQSDYYPWKVNQVIYHETGKIEVWTELMDNIDERGFSIEVEEEFDDHLAALIAEGWQTPHGVRPNTRLKEHANPSPSGA